MKPAIIAIAIAVAAASPVQAQHQHGPTHADTVIQEQARLRLPPSRTPTPDDSVRGAAVVEVARAAVARYRLPGDAEQDGYRLFAPQFKGQRVLHYVNRSNARRNRFSFDPARPTALLYRPVAGGDPELLGVMYTMPASATPDELDANVPVALASWHQHTNVCRPKGRQEDDIAAFMTAKAGRITTREACEAAGGRFMAESRNWMVHVNVMAQPEDIWEHRGHDSARGRGGHMR
jgi:hypothetical protein